MADIGVTPVTPADVFRSVRDQFAAANISTQVLVGESHLNEEGGGDRIVLVPDDGPAEMAPIRLSEGGCARFTLGCTAYVWGVQKGDDFERYGASFVILSNLVIALSRAATGRLSLSGMVRSQETRVLTYGEEFQLRFALLYQVNFASALVPLPSNVRVNPTTEVKEPAQ